MKDKQINLTFKYMDLKVKHVRLLCLLLFWLVFAICGAMLNSLAISANGGKMPVYSNPVYKTSSNMHFVTNNWSEINKPEVVDRFKIGRYYASIGDFFIFAGTLGTIILCVLTVINTFKLKKIDKAYNMYYMQKQEGKGCKGKN